MPIYIDLANLIIPKKVIEQKYLGGLAAFRNYFTDCEIQEDDELLSIAKMNEDEFDIEHLVSNLVFYDEAQNSSKDFVIVLRYGGVLWEVDWLIENKIFAWHKTCSQEVVDRALGVSAMNFEEISVKIKRGENPLKAISASNF